MLYIQTSDREMFHILQDKWKCEACSTLNTPIRRFCDRCYSLRNDWLLEKKSSPVRRPPHSPARRTLLTSPKPVKPAVTSADSAASLSCGSGPRDKRTELLQDLNEVLSSPTRKNLKLHTETPGEFRVPSSPLREDWFKRGSHLPRLRLPTTDSGIDPDDSSTTLPSSQESLGHAGGSQPPSTQSPVFKKFPGPDRLPPAFGKLVDIPPKSPLKKVLDFTDPVKSPLKRGPTGREYSDICMICLSKPKEASIIHGKTGHQVCCYVCAKRLKRRGKPCPVCRRPIQKVIKNYLLWCQLDPVHALDAVLML